MTKHGEKSPATLVRQGIHGTADGTADDGNTTRAASEHALGTAAERAVVNGWCTSDGYRASR